MVSITIGYVSRDTLKQVLHLTDTAKWDSYLDDLIQAAMDAVDRETGRTFSNSGVDETKYFDGHGTSILEVDDFESVTSVKVDTNADGGFATTLTEGMDFVASPVNDSTKTYLRLLPSGSLEVFPHGFRVVEVSATWGWAAVPGPIQVATELIASRLFKRRDVDYEHLHQSELNVMDKDVRELLDLYRKQETRARKPLGAI